MAKQGQQVAVINMYVSQTAHRGLNDFGIKDIGRIQRTVDGVDAEPVGNTDDGSDVARVLNSVEG